MCRAYGAVGTINARDWRLEAKNKFGQLLDWVERGEEITITRHGREVARLVPAKPGFNRAEAHAALRRIRERAEQMKLGAFDWSGMESPTIKVETTRAWCSMIKLPKHLGGSRVMRGLLVSLLKGVNFIVRKLSAFTHFAQFAVQWGFNPRPEWFDHFLDQHWQFSAKNNGLWVERGVFSRLVIKPNAKMLEICCGDGFNARHFYSSRASSIIALDFDKDAIPHAKRYNSTPNITYVQKDIRDGLPTGPFDNIVWDAAIEHFTEAEIDKILREIVQRLGSEGILSGYTLTEAADGKKSNALHEYEFKDKEDLRRFFTPHFKFVKVWETIYPTRHNLYFAASQTPIEVFG